MGRLTGVLGILAILLFAYLFSTDRKAIRKKTIVIGLVLQFIFALLILRVGFGERVMTAAGNAVNRLAELFVRRLGVYLWRTGQQIFEVRFYLRLPGVADHHLHRRVFCGALSLRHYAVHHQAVCPSDDAVHGSNRRRVNGRRRQHLHGSDRSSPDDSSLFAQRYALGTDGHHDRRHGACFRRHHGRVHPERHRGPAPAGSRHHDCSRHHRHREDAGARNRETPHRWRTRSSKAWSSRRATATCSMRFPRGRRTACTLRSMSLRC